MPAYRYADLSYRVFQFEEKDGSLCAVRRRLHLYYNILHYIIYLFFLHPGSPSRLLHRLRLLGLRVALHVRRDVRVEKEEERGKRKDEERAKSNLNERSAVGCTG